MARKRIGRWVTRTLLIVFVASLVAWLLRSPELPPRVRIATAEPEGAYARLGSALRSPLEARLGRPVDVEMTAGSIENVARLADGSAELAVVQGGTMPVEGYDVVTPLFPEYVWVVVREGSGIGRVNELSGKRVHLGKPGSGNRWTALRLLSRYGIDAEDLLNTEVPYVHLLDGGLDAAVITTNMMHQGVRDLLTGRAGLRLLSIDDADAVAMFDRFLRPAEVPVGVFGRLPEAPLRTVATTAFLVSRPDAPEALVRAALGAVHEDNLAWEFSTLVTRDEAAGITPTRLHPVARDYFHPQDQIGPLAGLVGLLATMRELLVAVAAGVFILWRHWQQSREREIAESIRRQKERLAEYLTELFRVEESQCGIESVPKLRDLSEQVTRLKMRALRELSEEKLRADATFSVFLSECAHLMNQIQLKIVAGSEKRSD